MNSISAQHMSGPPKAIVLVGPRSGIALPGQLDVAWCSATTANSRNTFQPLVDSKRHPNFQWPRQSSQESSVARYGFSRVL